MNTKGSQYVRYGQGWDSEDWKREFKQRWHGIKHSMRHNMRHGWRGSRLSFGSIFVALLVGFVAINLLGFVFKALFFLLPFLLVAGLGFMIVRGFKRMNGFGSRDDMRQQMREGWEKMKREWDDRKSSFGFDSDNDRDDDDDDRADYRGDSQPKKRKNSDNSDIFYA